jgi:hypothetical protein
VRAHYYQNRQAENTRRLSFPGRLAVVLTNCKVFPYPGKFELSASKNEAGMWPADPWATYDYMPLVRHRGWA